MGAYNRFEGEPCCGSNPPADAYSPRRVGIRTVLSYPIAAPSATSTTPKGHKTHPDAASASSAAVLSGTDLECGSNYRSLIEGVKRGTHQ